MSGFWKKIPRTFRACIIVSLGLMLAVCAVVAVLADPGFAVQTAILSVFSFALLCAYVVWASSVSMHVKMQAEQNGDIKEIASGAATKIQVGSLVKTLILAAFLVVMVAVFRFNPYAALIGVSIIYIPLYTVPLFVKPVSDNEKSHTESIENAKVEQP